MCEVEYKIYGEYLEVCRVGMVKIGFFKDIVFELRFEGGLGVCFFS